MIRQTFLVTAWLVLGTAIAGPSDAWQRSSKSAEGVVVSERADPRSPVISIRGEAHITAPVATIIAIMADNARAAEWMPYIAEKRDIRMTATNERIEYVKVDMPWPLADRYFVNRGRVDSLPDGALRVLVESVDDSFPTEPGLIRGVIYYSTFLLEPRNNGASTYMVLEVNSDPRGWIPTALVNFAQREWPKMFFTRLRQQLAKLAKSQTLETTLAH